jgi:hypothetical protein
MARFVTAGAIWLNLSVMMPLSNTPCCFFNFHYLTYILTSRWHLENQTFAILKLMVIGRMTKFLW